MATEPSRGVAVVMELRGEVRLAGLMKLPRGLMILDRPVAEAEAAEDAAEPGTTASISCATEGSVSGTRREFRRA
jgi:hypothetical protein